MFTKPKIFKFLFFYLSSKIILLLLLPFAWTNFFQIFNLENSANPDLVFNDLYFRAQYKNCLDNPHYTREKSVVLINSGSLDQDSFRLQLAEVLTKFKDIPVRAIGIDHDFRKIEKPGTDLLKQQIENNPKIIYSYRSIKDDGTADSSYLCFKAKKGDTNFPDKYTVRRYFSHDTSFAYQLAKLAFPEIMKGKMAMNETFNINFSTIDSGILKCHPDTIMSNSKRDVYFKYIEASDFLKDSVNSEFYNDELKDKIVIIGHLGTAFYQREYDIQDKLAVPIDMERIILREKTMHGVVIQANAIENLLHPESRFWEPGPLLSSILNEIAYILFLLFLFGEFGKLANIFTLLLISLPYTYFVLYLMDWNIYITVTSTMLQLFFIEEYVDICKPFYNRIAKKYKFLNH
jgi:CHASE2 domain-containing sensor protein